VTTAADLGECLRAIANRHVRPDDRKAWGQIGTALVPIAILWACVVPAAQVSAWLVVAITLVLSLFLVRVFVLMHDCGHGSMFRRAPLNAVWGFVLGVASGISQPVWSQRHQFHHATNGNWSKYRGPLNIITVDEYAALTPGRQRRYRLLRSIWLAFFGGFLYLILSPRLTWLRASALLVRHVVARKLAAPSVSTRTHAQGFSTPCCASLEEYGHMFWNNLAVLALWAVMAWAIGPLLFFSCYLVSLSLAGGAAIVLFTVQHNFEHAYASGDEGWDRDAAVIRGTSFLLLPAWLNWFTADIAYHHIHHLCARVPNYCLAACHADQARRFTGVARIRLSQIPHSLKYILWDTRAGQLVSVAEQLLWSAHRTGGVHV
jgi:omega-6 fatty acid desaturase (delta-12 desaturase)